MRMMPTNLTDGKHEVMCATSEMFIHRDCYYARGGSVGGKEIFVLTEKH